MRLLRRREPPDPFDVVREVTSELKRRITEVGTQINGFGADLDLFEAGVNDTAARLLEMAQTATDNTRESPDG